jgi:hypothetical protein
MGSHLSWNSYNPFRRPDWRLERVLQIVDKYPAGKSTPYDDEYIKKYKTFLVKYRNADEITRQKLGYGNPGMFWAHQIYDCKASAHRKSTAIEARILARLDDDHIANELHTIPETIQWYELLFFNVRDRLNSGDWIVDHVLMPAYEASLTAGIAVAEGEQTDDDAPPLMPKFVRTPLSEPFYDATLKMFGYFGGDRLLNYFLKCGFREGAKANSDDDIANWFDGHWSNRIRHRSTMAAQSFEVNKYNVMELFATHTRIIEIERSTDTQVSKTTQINVNVAAMLRNMPWAIGDAGRAMVANTALAQYDDGAAELRDSELMLISSGRTPSTVKGVDKLRLPPPRLIKEAAQKADVE